jgi:hypothetical protein
MKPLTKGLNTMIEGRPATKEELRETPRTIRLVSPTFKGTPRIYASQTYHAFEYIRERKCIRVQLKEETSSYNQGANTVILEIPLDFIFKLFRFIGKDIPIKQYLIRTLNVNIRNI